MTRPMEARTAVVVHAYHRHLLPEVRSYVARLTFPFDVIFTTPHRDLEAFLEPWEGLGGRITVSVHENRGRDVLPFVQLLRSGALDAYPGVLKVHLKQSGYSDRGDEWRRSLYDALFGDDRTARESLALLSRPGVGMVGPHRYFLSHPGFWGSNRDRLSELMWEAGALARGAAPRLGFFAGSMFWVRPEALAPLRAISDTALRCEEEAGQVDGTTAHALERAMGLVVRQAGYTVTSLPLGGSDIFEEDTSGNDVPVL